MKKGSIIKINNEQFEVLNALGDYEYDKKSRNYFNSHMNYDLHKTGSSSLLSTHLLKIYDDIKDLAFIFQLIKGIPSNKKKIFVKDIEIIKN